MKTSTFVFNHLLPRESAELGRLVTNVHDPAQDYYQPDPLALPTNAISIQRLENFNTILQNAKASGTSAFLTEMLSGKWSASRGVTTDIAAAAYETHQLGNCEQFLSSACQLATVRNWIERALRRRRKVYIICGIKVLVDAHVRQALLDQSEKSGSVQVPGALVTAAAGVPIPINDVLDVGMGTSFNTRSQERGDYFASGEHVFGIQYRKVKVGKFSTKEVGPEYLLGGSRWKVYLSTRGQPTDAEDGVEVESGEPISAQDIGKPCESFDVNGEEILLCT